MRRSSANIARSPWVTRFANYLTYSLQATPIPSHFITHLSYQHPFEFNTLSHQQASMPTMTSFLMGCLLTIVRIEVILIGLTFSLVSIHSSILNIWTWILTYRFPSFSSDSRLTSSSVAPGLTIGVSLRWGPWWIYLILNPSMTMPWRRTLKTTSVVAMAVPSVVLFALKVRSRLPLGAGLSLRMNIFQGRSISELVLRLVQGFTTLSLCPSATNTFV